METVSGVNAEAALVEAGASGMDVGVAEGVWEQEAIAMQSIASV